MAIQRKHSGFTLVEIMLVVGVIGLLAAIAIPAFAKARTASHRTVCISALRQIDSAKEQWAMMNNKANGTPSVDADVNTYLKAGAPSCPAGGSYTYNPVGSDPTCTEDGHVLP